MVFNGLASMKCLHLWKYMAVLWVIIFMKDTNLVANGAITCIFINANGTTTVSPTAPSSFTLLGCQDTCCCNKPQCCDCDTSNTSGLTFIPCHIRTATPVSPLPPLNNGWDETDFPLYEECYPNDTTTTSSNPSSTTYTTSNPDVTTSTTTSGPPPARPPNTSGSPTARPPKKEEGDEEDLSTESKLAIGLGLLGLVLIILCIFIVKRVNRKKMIIEDKPQPRPMTARPLSTYLNLPELRN